VTIKREGETSVLVVDDIPDQIELMSVLLRQTGHHVLVAANGTAGFLVAQQEHPRLVVIDVSIPQVDGIELCRMIRADAELRLTPILLVNALRKDAEKVIEGLSVGADDYLEAPFDSTLFAAKVARLTERACAEEVLRESEEWLRTILNASRDGIIVEDDGIIFYVNKAYAQLLGYAAPEELDGKHLSDILPPDEAERLTEYGHRRLCGERVPSIYEFKAKRKDNTLIDVEGSVSTSVVGGKRYITTAIRDISERKRAQESLHAADQRAIKEYEQLLDRIASLAQTLGTAHDLTTIFRALLDFARVSTPCNGLFVSLYDPEQEVRTAAYAWSDGEEVDVSTLPPMEMTGSPHSRAVSTGEIIITDDFQAAMAGLPKIDIGDLDPNLQSRSSLAVPMAVMGKIVGAVEVQSNKQAAFHAEHATALRMAANLSANAIENVRLLEREQAQAEQLRQSQKLEAIGQLAGGIAHDFNNLLTAILGQTELLLRQLKDEPLRQRVGGIKKAGERAAALTHQLLAFSRKQILEPKVIDLNDVVTDTDKLLRRLIGENIELVTMRDPALGRVKADPNQLGQVIINLAVNARDAMPDGGKLTIETKNVYLDEAYARKHVSVRPGRYVMLAISDTGHGMDDATQQQIFEPFFTTKEVGKGTGLGLSTVYGIVRQSGGNVWVYSEVERGTTFKIYLPLIEEETESAEQGVGLPDLPQGTETVLVVEDNDAVRELARDILEIEGYTVLEASHGSGALQICERQEEPIDLLITDVVMPEMSGRQLVAQLSHKCADVKVLYMSGYTDNAIVHHGVLDADTNFIQKPFTPDALARKVREVLDTDQA